MNTRKILSAAIIIVGVAGLVINHMMRKDQNEVIELSDDEVVIETTEQK